MKKPVQEKALNFIASDGVSIAARLWSLKGRRNLIVMVPGFGQHKDTAVMRKCCEIMADYGDILCLDLRGTGKSGGRYHFGAEESKDVGAALAWAKKRYSQVELLGFSLGAYISLRAAVEYPGIAKRLYFISGPTRVEDIVLTLGPLRNISVVFRPEMLELRRWGGMDSFFRWGTVFRRKPHGVDLAAEMKIPISVLAGGRDQLVLPRLSRRVYEAANVKKLWTEFSQGFHAESLMLLHESDFRDWFIKSRAALSGRGK